MERVSKDKCSSLFGIVVGSEERKRFYDFDTRSASSGWLSPAVEVVVVVETGVSGVVSMLPDSGKRQSDLILKWWR